MAKNAFKPWRRHGTDDFANWTPGRPIMDIAEIKIGDIVFLHSSQHDALNLAKVLRSSTDEKPAILRMVNPSRHVGDPDFCQHRRVRPMGRQGGHDQRRRNARSAPRRAS